MQPTIPLDLILEQLRAEQQPERPMLRLYAPEPADPLHDPRDPEWPPRKIGEDERPERGVAIIDFTI